MRKRLIYCQEMLRRKNVIHNFFDKILWSDEAAFTTAGVFNRRNKHIWATTNPHSIAEIKFQGRKSLHVWCGIIKNKIIGPIFYEGSLSGQRYLAFLHNEIEARLEDLPVNEYYQMIWHQDGAPPHNIVPVTEYLNNRYDDWLGRHGTIQWPPNSPDLTPLDAFLWGYLKNLVYAERSTNLQQLRQKITHEIETLNNDYPEYISNAINKLEDDYIDCIDRNGGHIQQL